MKTELFAISEYCSLYQVDRSFITALQQEGLISITFTDNNEYIGTEELHELEMYTRLHQDMGINIEGIDVIRHLLQKMKEVQSEMNLLKDKLRVYEEEE